MLERTNTLVNIERLSKNVKYWKNENTFWIVFFFLTNPHFCLKMIGLYVQIWVTFSCTDEMMVVKINTLWSRFMNLWYIFGNVMHNHKWSVRRKDCLLIFLSWFFSRNFKVVKFSGRKVYRVIHIAFSAHPVRKDSRSWLRCWMRSVSRIRNARLFWSHRF